VGRGSWVVGRGSWVVGRGSWVVGRGSWVVGRGSWVVGRGEPEFNESIEHRVRRINESFARANRSPPFDCWLSSQAAVGEAAHGGVEHGVGWRWGRCPQVSLGVASVGLRHHQGARKCCSRSAPDPQVSLGVTSVGLRQHQGARTCCPGPRQLAAETRGWGGRPTPTLPCFWPQTRRSASAMPRSASGNRGGFDASQLLG
jgi:hypothetical protein